MTKAELETKHLSELHLLAHEAGIERFRMLTRAELIEALAENGAGEAARGSDEERERRRRHRRGGRAEGGAEAEGGEREAEREPAAPPAPVLPPAPVEGRRRRRRRRRFGRRRDGITIQDLLLPPDAGRQAILCGEDAPSCTALLRSVAADLSAESKGPEPVVLLVDPTPEELADWKREAPQAELVAAGQPHHASDALAAAQARAAGGEDVILLVDSLTRLAAAYGDAEAAKEFFDAGRRIQAPKGSLTVVAAIERPAS